MVDGGIEWKAGVLGYRHLVECLVKADLGLQRDDGGRCACVKNGMESPG